MSYKQCLQDLSLASRILAHHGIVDGYGHVSCRDPRNPKEYYLLSRNMAPALVKPEDIVTWRISDAEPVVPDAPRGFLERCIHSEIYRQYEDVQAIVHFHSPDIIPFGLMSLPFKPVYHMASFLGADSPPIFDMRDAIGPATDMLIRNTTHGAALASSFAPSNPSEPTLPLVLMRGHGATLTAPSLKISVFRAVYTQHNARILTSLSSLVGGASDVIARDARFLSAEECDVATKTISGQVDRAWEVWCKELEA